MGGGGEAQSIRIARLSLQSSELGPPPPHPQVSVASPIRVQVGGTHSLGGEGAGGANSDEGEDILVLRYRIIPLLGGGGAHSDEGTCIQIIPLSFTTKLSCYIHV